MRCFAFVSGSDTSYATAISWIDAADREYYRNRMNLQVGDEIRLTWKCEIHFGSKYTTLQDNFKSTKVFLWPNDWPCTQSSPQHWRFWPPQSRRRCLSAIFCKSNDDVALRGLLPFALVAFGNLGREGAFCRVTDIFYVPELSGIQFGYLGIYWDNRRSSKPVAKGHGRKRVISWLVKQGQVNY